MADTRRINHTIEEEQKIGLILAENKRLKKENESQRKKLEKERKKKKRKRK